MPCIKLLPCHTRWPPQGVLCKGGSHIADKDHKHEVTEVNWCPELDLEHDSYSWGNTKIVNFGIFIRNEIRTPWPESAGVSYYFCQVSHSHRIWGTVTGGEALVVGDQGTLSTATETPRHRDTGYWHITSGLDTARHLTAATAVSFTSLTGISQGNSDYPGAKFL